MRFRNTLYSPGDDVYFRQAGKDRQPIGKIVAIAKTANIQFPLLLVAWYFSRDDPIIQEQEWSHLGSRELIFSHYEDWQYVEALQGKVRVVDADSYRYLDPREKEDEKLYYCRAYLPLPPQHLILPEPLCTCYCPGSP